jgi:NTP pyrophosphatase (non-canonical NTP hydrolase)
MTFEDLRVANRLRLPLFKNRKGELAHPDGNGSNWSIAEWTNAMAGEAGEACNIAKKLLRGDYGDNQELGIGELMDEIADVVIYADHVCQRVSRKLEIAVFNKFNETSERIGCEVKLDGKS